MASKSKARPLTPHRICVRVSTEMVQRVGRVVRMHSKNGIEPDSSEVLRAAINIGLAQLEATILPDDADFEPAGTGTFRFDIAERPL